MPSKQEVLAATMPKDHEIAQRLARQLHDAAQPISVLQGVLELALIESSTIEDYKQAIERALRESSRLLGCFLEMSDSIILMQQRKTVSELPGGPCQAR